MDQITFQYPAWFLGICLLLGLAYALVLYFRDRTFDDQPVWLRSIMSLLRFLSVALLSMLLLSPLLRLTSQEVQEPLVVVAQDLSSSPIQNLSLADSAAYVNDMKTMIESLKEKYQVHLIGFGEEVIDSIDWQFDQEVTDIDQALKYISDNYSDQNLGAVILATDGIYNRGRNPIYSGLQMKAPLYTIGLGDTTQRTDLLIKHIYHNKIAFLGDRFIVQADLAGKNLQGKSATLRLEKIDGKSRTTLEQIPIKITENQFFTTQEFIIDADKPGVQRYRVRITGLQDEITYANNSKDIFIEVIDGRQKVLVVGNSPHPDIAALKTILESNENYEVNTTLLEDFTGQVNDYNVIVLHQIPGIAGGNTLLSKMNSAKTPRLFVLGSQSNLGQFNNAQGLLKIQGGNRSGNEIQAVVDPTFNIFKISEMLSTQLAKFSPALAPFGQYSPSPAGQVLAYQKIGNVTTQYPLIMMGEDNQIKTAIIAAEGLWKWKLFDYLQNENHEAIKELISNTIQYLAIKEDKRRFRSSPSKNLFMDNEEIIFDAELYNNSYELINTPDVFLVVRNADGNEFNYTFNRANETYQINMGQFPDGSYQYTAYVDYDGQRQSVNGRFAVQPIQLESFETVADHVTLKQLSENQNGNLFYPNNLTEVASTILEDGQIKPILYQKVRTRSIIHLKWIFALLLGLICAEWFIRRLFGGY